VESIPHGFIFPIVCRLEFIPHGFQKPWALRGLIAHHRVETVLSLACDGAKQPCVKGFLY
jgi:hypothetical protein